MEEAGLQVGLLSGPTAPPPDGFPHQAVTAPWWVSEMPASADRHTASRHVHLDHVFRAIAENRPPTGDAAGVSPVIAATNIAWPPRIRARPPTATAPP